MRTLIFSDPHCGSNIGLTPPKWQRRAADPDVAKWTWNTWKDMLRRNGPFDRALFCGDIVDGKQKKSGGLGVFSHDMLEQGDIGVAVCNSIRLHAKRGFKMAGVTGTHYHVGIEGQSAEHYVASHAGWEWCKDREVAYVDGVGFDLCHHIGNSQVPHGGHTAPAREAVWNIIHEQGGAQPHVDVTVRGHVHRASHSGVPDVYDAFTLPSLQLAGGQYGRQKMRGWCHFGILIVETKGGKMVDWGFDRVKVQPLDMKGEEL